MFMPPYTRCAELVLHPIGPVRPSNPFGTPTTTTTTTTDHPSLCAASAGRQIDEARKLPDAELERYSHADQFLVYDITSASFPSTSSRSLLRAPLLSWHSV